MCQIIWRMDETFKVIILYNDQFSVYLTTTLIYTCGVGLKVE